MTDRLFVSNNHHAQLAKKQRGGGEGLAFAFYFVAWGQRSESRHLGGKWSSGKSSGATSTVEVSVLFFVFFNIYYKAVTFRTVLPAPPRYSAAHHVAALHRRLVDLSVTATLCQWDVSGDNGPRLVNG